MKRQLKVYAAPVQRGSSNSWHNSYYVQVPQIRKHGDGLFVTIAKFSQKAMDYANTHHIILIDGERLANLMIEYNFYVSTRKTFEIKAIDTDALAEYQDE